MNEPIKEGSIVMILTNNYSQLWMLKEGDICKVYKNTTDIFYAEIILPADYEYRPLVDDLGYYNYKIIHNKIWKLFV